MHSLDDGRFKVARRLSHFLLHHYYRGLGTRWLLDRLCHWLVPPADDSTICSTIYNVNLKVDLSDHIASSIYYLGAYEAGTVSVLKRFLHHGDLFLDVGAHIGFISCVVARFVGDSGFVYAVEPNPETFRILRENIRINSLENVGALEVALGAEVGKARIYENADKAVASLIRPKDFSEDSGEKIVVTTIDTLIENGIIRIPTFIKIDVEGFELEVLKGARKLLSSPEAPILCVEFEQNRGNRSDIYKFITSVNDYFLYRLKYGKSIPSRLIGISEENQLQNYDNIFCFLDKHSEKTHI